jgi:peptidoglycan/LPS O-acetylase OafA/YrhL
MTDSAQARKWVLPWRGPNPVRKTAVLVTVTITTIVGFWAFIAGSMSARDANPRSSALRLFGMAVAWVGATVRMGPWPNKKLNRGALVLWVVILLVAGYQLATS